MQGAVPVVVDLPESTWPITTTLMCTFSLLWEETCLASSLDTSCDRGGENVEKEEAEEKEDEEEKSNLPHYGGGNLL